MVKDIAASASPKLGTSPDHALPTLDYPEAEKPPSWWGRDTNGQLTKVYRDYAAYCDD